MFIIFCSDPFDGRQPDSAYAEEAAAVRALGGTYALIDYEALVAGADARRIVRSIEARPRMTLAIYRGWMLRPSQYERLFAALLTQQLALINTPDAYRHTHHFPESYAVIAAHTPASAWLPLEGDVPMDRVMEVLRPFGAQPVIVKDFVKSEKHQWSEACFIPSAADCQAVERVVRRFVSLRGPDLEEGLVFRAFVDLAPLGAHAKSGMPLAQEHRLFVLDGTLVAAMRYWEDGDYTGTMPPPDLFSDVAKAVRSRFFTMDVAQRRDGTWIIIELGDGQVAGLPETTPAPSFYAALDQLWPVTER